MSSLTRPLASPVLAFRIEEELFRLTRSEPLVQRGRTARTLVKDGPLRVTLIALGPDGQIAPHRAAGPITVQVVYGSIRFEVDGESRTLFAGDMLALEAEVEHAVDSATGGAFLLTVVAADNA